MLPRIAYLDFAGRWYSQVRYDLATSGIAPIAAASLGDAAPDDPSARHTFRRAVAERYGVVEDEVVPCLGTSGALFSAYATLLGRGTRLLVERPSYEPLWRVAEGIGTAVDSFERLRDAGFRLDPERVAGALRPQTKLVAITNPHNPSGIVATEQELSQLAVMLSARGVRLLVDEAYLELAAPRATARRIAENIITCSSATKCWGVAWARAGWLLLPKALADAAAHVERHTSGFAPPSSFAWGTLVVRRADDLVERAARLQAGKRELVDAFVERHKGAFGWVPPGHASLYGWVFDAQGRDIGELLQRAVETEGVLVAPGRFFGDSVCFRLSWTAPREVLAEGLQRLSAVLASS